MSATSPRPSPPFTNGGEGGEPGRRAVLTRSRLWICGAVADVSDGKWRHRVGAATALRLRAAGGGVPRVARGLATAGLWVGIPLGFAEGGGRLWRPVGIRQHQLLPRMPR